MDKIHDFYKVNWRDCRFSAHNQWNLSFFFSLMINKISDCSPCNRQNLQSFWFLTDSDEICIFFSHGKLMKFMTFSHNELTKLTIVPQSTFNFFAYHQQNSQFFHGLSKKWFFFCPWSIKISKFFMNDQQNLWFFAKPIEKIGKLFAPHHWNSQCSCIQMTKFAIFSSMIDEICDFSAYDQQNLCFFHPWSVKYVFWAL